MEEENQRPLLYFLKESNNLRDVHVIQEFLMEDEVNSIKKLKWIPRTAEYIWIYQKISVMCKKINTDTYQFQISGFGEDLRLLEDSEWTFSLKKGFMSTNKLVVILCTGDALVHMNHGEHEVQAKAGVMLVFPAFMWWKISGAHLYCTISGNHFM